METEVAEGLTHRPEDVVAFVNRLVNEHIEYDGPERRATRREPISVPVEVQGLDGDFRVVGQPFSVMTTDISGGGIGFVHSEPIEFKYIGLKLRVRSGDEFQLVASVRHCTRNDEFYEIGGRFLVKWDELARYESRVL